MFTKETMKDIECRKDIEQVLQAFYAKAVDDALIGHFFTQVIRLDVQSHVPVIADFWEAILFDTRGYRKNVMEVHQQIHASAPIRKEHLDRWVLLFTETAALHFRGSRTELMKQRARSIATIMHLKLNYGGISRP